MDKTPGETGETVMNYVNALDSKNFDLAATFIDEEVRIIGPAGENFGKPKDFTEMLKRYSGKYSILKIFIDGEDVCLLYDYDTLDRKVYMSSWYKVKNGKITYIRTVFDPSSF